MVIQIEVRDLAVGGMMRETVSPDAKPEETAGAGGLLLFAGRLFISHRLLFLLIGSAGFGHVLAGFLLVRFRRAVAHNFDFFCGLTHLRHDSFSEGSSIMRGE